MPHLEFTLDGPPVSHQARDRVRLAAWKKLVRSAASKAWKRTPLTGRLKCTIINFHEGMRALVDDDNMVKPIRDALNGLVYEDDKQITYSETIQVSIDAPVKLRRASLLLLTAYNKGERFVYVRIEDAPEFIQLPGDDDDHG